MQPKNALTEEMRTEVAKRIHRSACFQRVFSGADGELTLKEVDRFLGYRNDTFDPDPYIAAYNAGKRAGAIFIHNAIDLDVEEAKRLLAKKNERKM